MRTQALRSLGVLGALAFGLLIPGGVDAQAGNGAYVIRNVRIVPADQSRSLSIAATTSSALNAPSARQKTSRTLLSASLIFMT